MVEVKWAVCVLALAAGLFGAAYWFSSRDFTPEPPRPSFTGSIVFATTGLSDALEVTVTPEEDPASGQWSVLRLNVETLNVFGPVAVALTGDARISPSVRPGSDVAVPQDESEAAALAASGFSTVYFSPRGGGWPWEPATEPDNSATDVIVGVMDSEFCRNDMCGFSLELPLTEPVITTAGATWALSTPTFGVPQQDPLSRALFPYTEPRGSQVNQLFGEDEKWYLPSNLDVRLEVEQQVTDSLQLTGTAPTRALGGVWRGRAAPSPEEFSEESESRPSAGEVLKVDAVFQRPAVQGDLADKDARQQFYAGIFLSLAVSVLLWAVELWLNPRLPRR